MKSKIWDKTRYVLVFCVCVLDELLCTYSSMSSVTVIYLFFFFSSPKGASLLMMLKHYLTKDVFQAGIEIYLHNHKYGSAQSDDLWDSMNEVLIFITLLLYFVFHFSDCVVHFGLFICL